MRTALVTGASRGLGFALSRELADRGYRVAMLARDAARLEAAAAEVRACGGETIGLACDVTEIEQLRRAVRQAVDAWGTPPDLAVANAGGSAATWATSFSLPDAQRLMSLNYNGMLHLFDAVVPGMLERRHGCFVGVASLAGLRCLPGGAAYSASKAAIQAFLDTIRGELRANGVEVVVVNPWFVRTSRDGDGVRRPMMVEPDWAARVIVDGIEGGKSRIDFPLLPSLAMRGLALLPNRWFDYLVGRRWRRSGSGAGPSAGGTD